jgi:hypothetical protein
MNNLEGLGGVGADAMLWAGRRQYLETTVAGLGILACPAQFHELLLANYIPKSLNKPEFFPSGR